jgi:putative nucleotidyltransferase with HDIG domain
MTIVNNLSREELVNKATDLKVVPTLNGIVEKVFNVLGNDNSSFSDLGNVVQYDQSISSKIISIANSAYYSRGIEIFDLQRAMLTIGFEEVRGIVTCLIFMENILKKLKLKEQDLFALWRHSIQVACSSKMLSKRLLVEDPAKVYTISLLHDIGKIIFYVCLPDYGETIKALNGNGQDIASLEREAYGIDHQEIGRVIAIKWKFPADFINVIRHHHENQNADQYGSVFRLVNAANRFSHSTHDPSSSEGIILEKEKDAIAQEVDKIMDFLTLG